MYTIIVSVMKKDTDKKVKEIQCKSDDSDTERESLDDFASKHDVYEIIERINNTYPLDEIWWGDDREDN